jgi:hypothetical protein
MARDVLTGPLRPRVLVLGVSPFMLAVENTESGCQYWRYGNLTDLVEYVQSDRACSPGLLAAGPFRGLSNLAEFGIARSRKPSLETRPQHLQQGMGGYWQPEQASAKQALPPDRWQQVLDNFLPHAFTFRDDSRQALILRRFRDLAAAQNIRLVLVYPPQHTAFCNRLYRDGIEARYDNWLTAFCQREGIAYHDLRDPARYPDEDFEDPVHLNAHGAKQFSRALAKVLKTP